MRRRVAYIVVLVLMLLFAGAAARLGYVIPTGSTGFGNRPMPTWTVTGSVTAIAFLLVFLIFSRWWRILVAAASVVLLCVTCFLWGRSYVTVDSNIYWSDLGAGQLHGVLLSYWAGHVSLGIDSYYFPAGERTTFIRVTTHGISEASLHHSVWPLSTMSAPVLAGVRGNWGQAAFRYVHESSTGMWGIVGLSFQRRLLCFPFWAAALLFAAVPALMLPRNWRTIFRRQSRDPAARTCGTCGYDLRMHGPGDHCPECGITSLPASVAPA